ncbi:AfsR/SARP family transcriptional regulator [Pseudonocardia sp. TRM90224]|uniref:AfsR/SARP family transcriptional regulator n=1 Tax=Pseudonocardia sp. TRM90224 TaxID=2812678 RepID=UPI001E535FB6|nr:BTAD domain-containing putative transcriptional regulator [Pseudonocardia sp. TRM90224]
MSSTPSTTFGVLGPVTAWDATGAALPLRGPRHRAVLARLLVARGRVVPVTTLVDDLWTLPPEGALSAVRTFVGALRRALEPDRPPRSPATLLVTDGPGYALRADTDAARFEAATTGPTASVPQLVEALGWWRGPAYTDVADQDWARAERGRLTELHATAVERLGEARVASGRAAEAVPDLDAHVETHPWREQSWMLLARALHRSDRQGDALAVLRRARAVLVEQLGIDPGPALRRLEADILRQVPHPGVDVGPTDRVWTRATTAYDVGVGRQARLESTVGLLRTLATTGGSGLEAAQRQRVGVIGAAETLGDPELTARVIGAYDVPAIWTSSDDPQQAAAVVEAAERTLTRVPSERAAARARLLATIALESRGSRHPRAREAAVEAERLARAIGDPALLAFALNGSFMQTFHRTGLASARDRIGAELVDLATRNDLPNAEVLGHLVRLQARSGLGDFAGADEHAGALDDLASRHERPLVGLFTSWYRALRGTATYDAAIRALDGAGMPGLTAGLPALARLCVALRDGSPVDNTHGLGSHQRWAAPLLLAPSDPGRAAGLLRELPDPPPGLLQELHWCLMARAAIAIAGRTAADCAAADRVSAALTPAAGEQAGAASGLVTLGTVAEHLAALDEVRG